MQWCYLLVTAFLACCIIQTDSARILGFFYFQSKSYFVISEKLMKTLAERGHDVVVVSHFPQKKKIPNYKDISIKGSAPDIVNAFGVDKVRNQGAFQYFHFQWEENVEYCEAALKHPSVQKLIKSNETFDLIISGLFGVDCWPGFAHKFKAPVISVVSTASLPWANSRIGNPDNPSYIPHFWLSYRPEMNLKERLVNLLTLLFTSWGQYFRAELPTDRILREHFGEDLPPTSEMIKNVSLVLTNSHFSFNQPRPAVPAFVEVGGLHITPPKKLPADLEKYISEAPHGVIYFSLGSFINASSFPEEKRQAFVEGFRQLPQRILWNIDGSKLKDIPPNVKTSSWFPQMDILGHPNVRAFISHGGLHSAQEAVFAGVPIIGMPLFCDQQQNVAGLIKTGAAIKLCYRELSKESVIKTVQTVLEDPSYKQNAQHLSRLFRDRPQTALETAIYWTEYVIRHKGAPHLRSAAADMHLYQYLLLDVIAVLFAALLGGLTLLWIVFKKIAVLVTSRKKQKQN